MSQQTPPKESEPPLWPLLVVSAWVMPGLGHWLLGERWRGLIVGVTLLGLFAAGLLIGSIDVVDWRREPLWFAFGQAHIGPLAFVVSEIHVILAERSSPFPHRSVGRVNELGTLYCAVAGGLNLLAILDLLGRVGVGAAAERDHGAEASR